MSSRSGEVRNLAGEPAGQEWGVPGLGWAAGECGLQGERAGTSGTWGQEGRPVAWLADPLVGLRRAAAGLRAGSGPFDEAGIDAQAV